MAESSIEWTNKTWNPVSGCTRVSDGCDNCYSVTMTKRLEAMGQAKYSGLVNLGKGHFNGVVKCHEDALRIPFSWSKPCRVFVNSMSDLFHKEVPFEFVDKVFAVMALTPHITYQILTKRPERMAEYFEFCKEWSQDRQTRVLAAVNRMAHIRVHPLTWPLPNVWLGTSVENQEVADDRIPHLLRCPAAVRFLSCEPLLGPVDLPLYPCLFCGLHRTKAEGGTTFTACDKCWDDKGRIAGKYPVGIHWVIVGGESGPKARPMHPEWAASLRDQCQAASVPFFFKQWGAWEPLYTLERYHGSTVYDFPGDQQMHRVGKHRAGRILDGREHNEFPEAARG